MSRRKSTDFRERSRGCSANPFMRISFDCALKKLSRLKLILLDFKCFNLRFERGRRYSQLRGRPEIARDFSFSLSLSARLQERRDSLDDATDSQLGSTERISLSHRMTDLSITLCSSRI